MSVPYKTANGVYFIPYADIKAAAAWECFTGTAVAGGTTDDTMCRTAENARKARAFVAFSADGPTGHDEPPAKSPGSEQISPNHTASTKPGIEERT